MRLLKAQHYLRLSTSPDSEGESFAFSLRFSRDLKSLLKQWEATTRISPVWRLKPDIENARAGDRPSSDGEVFFLCGRTPAWFANHISRESLSLLGDDSLFLTLGVFSLIAVSYFPEVSSEIAELCTKHHIPYERWYASESPTRTPIFEELSGDRIVRVDPRDFAISAQDRRGARPTVLLDNSEIQADATLASMALELYALLSVIDTRSQIQFSTLAQDSREIELVATRLITSRATRGPASNNDESPEAIILPDAEPQDLLLTLNAALSRLGSQAFSGTSPILQTECHFWPHSLLGIGVASLALRNLAAFATRLVVKANYHTSYIALGDKKLDSAEHNPTSPTTGMPHYLRLSAERLAELPSIEDQDVGELEPRPSGTPTPLTYYSGRDGFSNNALTVSAPLPCVSGCASYQWNLGTITHELSHRIIAGKLQRLLRGLLYRVEAAKISSKPDLLNFFKRAPNTVRELSENLIGFTLLVLHVPDYKDGKLPDLIDGNAFFRKSKDMYSVRIEETLVHIFDYYHFYGAEPKSYVDFVWLSWAVQPSIIKQRDEYIRRTLAALAVRHMGSTNWKELALGDFASVLAADPLNSELHLREEIVRVLSDPDLKQKYNAELEQSQYLIHLFHAAFKSEKLREFANEEPYRAPHNRSMVINGASQRVPFNYVARPGIFGGDAADPPPTFTNPFSFLRDFSRSPKPAAWRSAWLLHMIAFEYEDSIDPEARAS